MKDINNKELSDKDLEQVNGGRVEEKLILAYAEMAKEEFAKLKELQLEGTTQCTMSVMIEMGEETKR